MVDPGAEMPRYMVHHRHQRNECRVAFAAWRGFSSPLRCRSTVASCEFGGHEMWWQVEAASEREALALLPRWVASRASVARIDEVGMP
jgi:hypothetical protein